MYWILAKLIVVNFVGFGIEYYQRAVIDSGLVRPLADLKMINSESTGCVIMTEYPFYEKLIQIKMPQSILVN